MRTAATTPEVNNHVDVLIVGAGLSGIGAAVHVQTHLPGKSYAMLEGRQAMGGTWDLFRYPGVRSDSDMYTFGYGFKPWTGKHSIADGASIRAYISEAARDHHVDRHIRYGHRVVQAEWSSEAALWTVTAERDDCTEVRVTCNFLMMCSGYYSYTEPHRPAFANEADFDGQIVHPQFWPDDLDWEGKRIVVIGSGATAVTLIPSIAKSAAHVTMLQRTPTYISSQPKVDKVALRLRRVLPAKLAYRVTRVKNVLLGQMNYTLSRRRPDVVSASLLMQAQQQLGPDFDVGKHFSPPYKPWDQRVCVAPDGDLFDTIRRGRASVVTDTIDRFTATGIVLTSGEVIQADIIVTATGLKLNLLGDVRFMIDGQHKEMSETLSYKGVMFSDVPNLAMMYGYTNASWTLKSDLASLYACRLLKKMDDDGTPIVVPRGDPMLAEQPFIEMQSGFFQRAKDTLPKQGSKHPWKLYQNYMIDFMSLRFGTLDDGVLAFRRAGPAAHPYSPKTMVHTT